MSKVTFTVEMELPQIQLFTECSSIDYSASNRNTILGLTGKQEIQSCVLNPEDYLKPNRNNKLWRDASGKIIDIFNPDIFACTHAGLFWVGRKPTKAVVRKLLNDISQACR